jgi:hypothetical protein
MVPPSPDPAGTMVCKALIMKPEQNRLITRSSKELGSLERTPTPRHHSYERSGAACSTVEGIDPGQRSTREHTWLASPPSGPYHCPRPSSCLALQEAPPKVPDDGLGGYTNQNPCHAKHLKAKQLQRTSGLFARCNTSALSAVEWLSKDPRSGSASKMRLMPTSCRS